MSCPMELLLTRYPPTFNHLQPHLLPLFLIDGQVIHIKISWGQPNLKKGEMNWSELEYKLNEYKLNEYMLSVY